jgi:hypothetical protein
MNAHKTCQSETSARRAMADSKTMSGASRPRPRVLVVDDEPHVLEGVRLALRKQPYEIRTSTRADTALEMQRALAEPTAALAYHLLTRVRMQDGRILTLPEFVFGRPGRILVPSLDRWVVRHIMQMMHARGRT